MTISNPFDLLQDLETRTLKGLTGMPALDRAAPEWVGVGFRIGDSKLIASMSEVKEIIDLPEYTLVPGVKPWVVGVANVRGSLLPILDMKTFLLGEEVQQKQKARVIVIDHKGFNTGLIVEEIYGMRHFRDDDETDEIPKVNNDILPYVGKAFKQDEEHWPVFDFSEMSQDERFTHASL